MVGYALFHDRLELLQYKISYYPYQNVEVLEMTNNKIREYARNNEILYLYCLDFNDPCQLLDMVRNCAEFVLLDRKWSRRYCQVCSRVFDNSCRVESIHPIFCSRRYIDLFSKILPDFGNQPIKIVRSLFQQTPKGNQMDEIFFF
ncbi:hypothetical protein DFA_10331 [Cavenderia fasciculata]|uniref:Uncharacterized protein n=1 Tax=Cavenderia fasciculata TaxID=261658 RepID=F4Q9X2_CACFS|nr:uncharacterized protein DFA_10331 [Cavenderia fasciculata]EGG15491.1 hypothetical protein DFA_10331 [Cavenderia fasciculata]|eukprot:XP_004354233.1 hypothetical protein DFA_10331 [Cavenderia fasciculata]